MPPETQAACERVGTGPGTALAQTADGVEWWRPQAAERLPCDGRPDVIEERQSPVPFWSLMTFTGVLILAPQAYVPALASLRPALLVIAVCLVSYLLDAWARRKPVVRWNRPFVLIAMLVAWAVMTVPLSLWPGGSVAVLLDQYLKTVLIFWLLSQVLNTPARGRRAAWILTWMAIGLALMVFYNYATGAMAGPGLNQERVRGNEGGLTKNPNDLALMINLIVPVTVGLLLANNDPLKRKVLLLALGMEIATVVLSYSRGGAVTLGLIVLFYLWKLRRRPERTWLYGLIVAGLLAVPLAPSSYFERLSTITDVQADRTGSAQERWADMVVAVKTILANPVIGAGIGMNTLAMKEARGGWLPVHNVYLEHALDLGFPGLLLFLLLFAACLKASIVAQRGFEREGRTDMRLLAEGLQISLLAYATAAMFHPVSYHPYFYYMAGFAVALANMCAGTRGAEETAV
jgi:O-antigen ligase